ncbi:unnamed protein product, partial [Thlaspi arvense]
AQLLLQWRLFPHFASSLPDPAASPQGFFVTVELEKQSYCDLKVANKTEHYVAFKVKTTSPKKYFVRPNTGVIQPWDSCIIRDMQCKDKFLLQSTIVPPHTDVDELPQDTAIYKDSGKTLTECKLKVSYITPSTTQRSSESGATNGDGNGSETITVYALTGGVAPLLPSIDVTTAKAPSSGR